MIFHFSIASLIVSKNAIEKCSVPFLKGHRGLHQLRWKFAYDRLLGGPHDCRENAHVEIHLADQR